MVTTIRNIRPKCPECGFSIFNRRFAKCESCGVQLPISLTYTADELRLLKDKEKAEVEYARKEKDKTQGGFTGNDSTWLSGSSGGFDLDFSD